MTIEALKRNSKQKTEKIAPPFTSLPSKFKTRFYCPASLTDTIDLLLFSSKILVLGT